MNFFISGFRFIKDNPKILYSVALVILIPLAFFYNTFFTISAFQKNINFNMQTDALLAENILGNFISDFITDQARLQEKITKITKDNDEIKKLWIAVPKGESLEVIASRKTEEIGVEIQGNPLTLAWENNQAVAYPVSEGEERFWEVIKPLKDDTGRKIAVVGMSMSLKAVDDLTKKTVYGAYFTVAVAIALALFLTIHHTALFGYVALSKKLKEIDKMKDDFIRMATHELQTPIANIRGYTEALEEEIGSALNSEQKELLLRISISSKNLADLIFDILEVSMIEQGRLDFTPQQVSPSKIIKEAIEELKGKADIKNLQLFFVGEETSDLLLVNQQRLKQVIVNLINNSIKYTPAGKIETGVSVDKTNKRCVIFIHDTGLGISAEAQQSLFERFYRVKTPQTAGIPGTGLGLWITKHLCEKMGGSIFIESMEGVGTKALVVFPLVS